MTVLSFAAVLKEPGHKMHSAGLSILCLLLTQESLSSATTQCMEVRKRCGTPRLHILHVPMKGSVQKSVLRDILCQKDRKKWAEECSD